jgi:hypothetical protein
MPSWYPGFDTSDAIAFDHIDTSGGSAGNGGNGRNYGDQHDNDTATFNPFNYAYGPYINAPTGDYVGAYATWDAGDGGAGTGAGNGGSASDGTGGAGGTGAASGTGGNTESNGDQSLATGGNTADITSPTTAYQTNWAYISQGAHQIAGIGGNGGSDNHADGGPVVFSLTYPTTVDVHDVSVDGLYDTAV